MFTKKSTLIVAILLCCLISLSALADSSDSAAKAKDILAVSGIKGGLVVHLGCGDGRLTAELKAGDRYLVHGLDADAENVAAARNYLSEAGHYRQVSVAKFDGKRLPYADNLVNIVVVSGFGCQVSGKEIGVLARICG